MIRSLSMVVVMAALLLLTVVTTQAALDSTTAKAIDNALTGEHRNADNATRDRYRRPKETLDFLGFRSDMTVVEIWPGAGWYTEILAPALRGRGKLYAAQFSVNGKYGYQRRAFGDFLSMLGKTPDMYRDVVITHFALPYQLEIAPPESADMVLTFRNVHNWVSEYYGSGKYADAAFTAMFDALKPGGTLGIVDHRWPTTADEDPLAKNGYISKERIVALAEAAGFELAGESDLLRNPKDTRDYERGVWTLPPSMAMGKEDEARYLAIGESDRILLKFIKPKK